MGKKTFLTAILLTVLIFQGFTQVTVDFSASVTRSCVSTPVVFTNLSSSTEGNIVDLEWDLAGIYANKDNPSTIFTDPGSYDICLIATDELGNTDTLCREGFVIIWEKPIANFINDPQSGCTPLEVDFSNTSSSANGEISEAIWDVGGSTNLVILDNPDSLLQSTYVTPGLYSASLFIRDDKGCTATVVRSNAITVFPKPIIDYTFEVISGCDLPWEVQFTNLNSDSETIYNWDFGNGETYVGANPPLVVYDTTGSFDLTIALEKNGCVDTIRETNLIKPGSAPDFSVSPIGACVDTELTFFESSQISADSIFWSFGDGNTSTENNPVHTYNISDCYEVTMIRYSGECIDTVTNPCLMINAKPTLIASVENQFSCSLPTELELKGAANLSGSFIWEITGVGDDKILFGDTTSLLINQEGSYNVALEYISDNGCTASIDDFPVILESFELNLPNKTIEGCSPLSVSLQDSVSSNLDIVSWEWTVESDNMSLGGGTLTFDTENPNFTLSDTGRYDVQLIVENEIGCVDTVKIEEYIKVGIKPFVDFVATPLEDCILAPKDFTALTSDFADSWVWGTDGTDTLSIEQNPSLFLTTAKSWDISLTAYHNGCANTIIKEDYINVLEPGVSYRINYDCDNPYTVSINDFTTGADSSFWEVELSSFQRDTFINIKLDQYTFPERGRYFINHYAVNFGTGCEHYRSDTIIITDPKAIMTLDTTRGCTPLTININGDSQDDIYIKYEIPGASIDSTLSVTDPSITYAESGLFLGPKLIVTDLHGCMDTMIIADSILVNKATAIPGFVDGVCVPGNTELIDKSTDLLGEIVERKWYFDDAKVYSEEESFNVEITENKFYNLALAVKDDWGCVDSIYIDKTIYGSLLDPNFIASDTIPCTKYGVTFSIEKTNQGVTDYIWHFGDGNTSTDANPIHGYAEEGIYTVCVTINDQYNCPRTSCKENYVTVLNPKASFSGDPLFETCPPLITNFSNTSVNAINFKWDFGDNSGLSDAISPSHLYNDPGKFSVSLIASNAPYCADTLLLEDYVIVDGPSGNLEFTSDSSCLPLTLTLIGNADEEYTFGWDYGNGETSISSLSSMTDTIVYVYEETGTFLPKLILSDGNGCTRSFISDSVIVNSLALDFVSDTDTACVTPAIINLENQSISTDPTIEYKWQIIGNENLEFETEDVSSIINESGAYTVILSAKGANCVDTFTLDSQIQIATTPVVDFEFVSNQICEETTVVFDNLTTNDFGDFVEYEWSFGDGTISNEEEGSHLYTDVENLSVSLTATSEYGCSDSQSETFSILPNGAPLLPENYTMCIGDSVIIEGEILGSGASDVILSWNLPINLSCADCLQPVASPIDTTEYIITATHSNGCVTMDTMDINVVPLLGPALSLSLDTIVCNNDTAVIAITNYDSGLTYVWENSPTLNCLDCEFVSAYPDDDTHYTVTVFNQFGCFKTDSLLVEVEREIPNLLIDDRGICEGESTTITLSDEALNPSWQSDNSLSCQNCIETIATPSESMFYYVDVSSAIGCDYRDSVYVTVIPTDTMMTSDDSQICLGEEMLLTSSGWGDPLWTPAINLSSETDSTTFASPEETTMYTVTYTYDECIQSSSVLVDVIYKADISAIGDTICEDETAELVAFGKVNSFIWVDEMGNELAKGDTIFQNTEVDQTLFVIGELGLCEEDTAQVIIKVQPSIDVTIGTYDYLLYINSAEVVDIEFNETADYTYSWYPSNGLSCDNCPDPKISDIGERMQYELTVLDELTGCYIEEVINVRFTNQCSEKAFYIPNIFSPNGDGSNDYFQILAERPEEFIEIKLFDRWGNQIYVSSDVRGRWDGNYKAQPIATGVYPYRIDYICFETGEQLAFYGDVTVIR